MSATCVYRTDRAEVWHGDSRDVLPQVATESLGLVLCDPPFGAEFVSGRRAVKRAGTLFDGPEDRPVIQEVMVESVRVVGQHRHLYAFGPADAFDGCKVAKPVELIWDKGAMGLGDLSLPWGPQHETIQFTVSKHRHAGETGATTLGARMRQGSVLTCARPGARRHPNEKPVAILRQMIESSSVLGDTVLDPFAGSGSTGVAALLEGRRAFLVELDERYIDTIVTRLAEAEAWLSSQPV